MLTDEKLAIEATRRMFQGTPDSIALRVADAKVVDFAAARKRLRPPEPGSLAATLQTIGDGLRRD